MDDSTTVSAAHYHVVTRLGDRPRFWPRSISTMAVPWPRVLGAERFLVRVICADTCGDGVSA